MTETTNIKLSLIVTYRDHQQSSSSRLWSRSFQKLGFLFMEFVANSIQGTFTEIWKIVFVYKFYFLNAYVCMYLGV
jgi:hypothetical protein